MARVNFEESAFAAAKRIAWELDMRPETVAGKLLFFWHDTQSLEIETASKYDLACWLDPEDLLNEAELNLFLTSMEKTGLLEREEEDLWRIVGNRKHIDNLRQRREAAIRGGEASAKARLKQTVEPNASTERLNRTLEPKLNDWFNPEQNRTEQSSTEQNRTEKKEECPTVDRSSRPTVGAVDELAGNPVVETMLRDVSQSAQKAWLAAYPDSAWIKAEILKAHAWLEVNPKKKSKSTGRFLGNWLSRGWENHRKTLPSVKPPPAPPPKKEIDPLEKWLEEQKQATLREVGLA